MSLLEVFQAGWLGLLDYLAAHVLLCLVPAFFIAGYLSGLMPKEVITRYLGPDTRKWVSYPAAAAGGFLLAVCSCTILPLFAGIWKRGAGLGPAITFLFVGPAVNILAISYTGAAIGLDIALARIVLSLSFGMAIGLIMAALFKSAETQPKPQMFQANTSLSPTLWWLFGLLVAILVVGTLQTDIFTKSLFSLHLSLELPVTVQSQLDALHLTLQGALLIGLLIVIVPIAWKGLNNVLNEYNRWTWLALVLVAVTLLFAAPTTEKGSLIIHITGRFVAETILIGAVAYVALRHLERDQLAQWLAETWRFVKQIFPWLLVGVFAAGMLRALIPEDWIRTLAGQNTLPANLLAVSFGVFMYFPTLVEVPVARAFLDLGMNRGPLLAYLLADPELSLQSILVTSKILGRRKTAVYVGLVALFSTLAGYLFGAFLASV